MSIVEQKSAFEKAISFRETITMQSGSPFPFKKTLKAMLRAILFVLLGQTLTFSQGFVEFNNRNTAGIDAPVWRGPTLPFPGRGAGPGFSAQLYLVKPDGSLQALEPISHFRTSSMAAWPFIERKVVQVPDVPVNGQAKFRMRAFETAAGSYEAALALGMGVGESQDTGLLQLGDERVHTLLHGLEGFTVDIVPEPGTFSLMFLGALGLMVLTKRRRS